MGNRTDREQRHIIRLALTTKSGTRVHERTIELRDKSRHSAERRAIAFVKAGGATAIEVVG